MMRRRLPPFAALRAFEAAGRLNNFKKAAEDIDLSASAVSHQVRSLEEYLGVQLFNREGGKPKLTSAGAVYLESIQFIFDKLEAATKSVSECNSRPSLVVNLFHSLASCWLIPHLPHFQKKYPDVDIKLLSTYEPIEFTSGDIDLAIRYGEGNWPGLSSDLLFQDELSLVCSPEMAEKLPPLFDAADLCNFTQIRCSLDPSEWQDWFQRVHVEMPEFKNSLELDSRALALEAAAKGLGIAIGRMPYVIDDLNMNRLCDPYSLNLSCKQGYYLVYPEQHSNHTHVASFREWLLDECNITQQ
jgi:LysR family glycine cleavage system transcriptional activator